MANSRERNAPILSSEVGALALEVNESAPDFTLKTLSEKVVQLNDFRGQPVVIYFWASWCRPCNSMGKMFQETHKRYGKDLVILAVNIGETTDQVQKYLKGRNFSYPILLDSDQVMEQLYQIKGLPITLFLDTNGIIRSRQYGLMSNAELAEHLTKIGVIPKNF
jgi:peroxiredoxin